MHCFQHSTENAVGICKACSKAVCKLCAKDTGFALACSETCAAEALIQHELIERSKRIYGIGKTGRRVPIAAIVPALISVLFLWVAVSNYLRSGTVEPLSFGMGVIMAVMAIVVIVRSRSLGIRL